MGLLVLVTLAACASPPTRLSVYDRTRPETVTSGSHVVKAGETLYAIAWRYGQDFKRLAAVNGIRAPFTIYPGQRLRLGGESRAKNSVVSSAQKKTVVRPSQPVTSVVKSPSNKKQSTIDISGHDRISRNVGWRWPASGKLITRYSSRGQSYKGIAIGGQIGQPVMATASGQVVYSGDGLTGYGNLIIIRHNSRYLSAYAHNKSLLVSEGDVVKAGQKIAELGSTGTNEPKLHFEIRQNGKPVDPLLLLPKR